MKYLILVLFFAFLSINTIAQTKKDFRNVGVNKFTTVGNHPYLFYSPKHIEQLQNAISSNSSIENEWLQLIDLVSDSQKSGLGAVDNLGLAYLMTGEINYAKKLKEILFSYCNRQVWEEDNLINRKPSWNAGLLLAKITRTIAVGYDCIYDYLTPEERKFIVDNLVNKGILPTLNDWLIGFKRIHSFDSMGHNWWSVCVYNAGIAILAILDEDPRAGDWLNEIVKSIPQWVEYQGTVFGHKPANFDREGGFYEGVNYAAFAISALLKFRLAYLNTFPDTGFIDLPVLDKVDKFFIDACYPNSGGLMSVNFGDGEFGANDENPVALLLANGLYKERYNWYLNQFEKKERFSGSGFRNDESPLAFDLIYSPGIDKHQIPDSPDLPHSALYPDMGWAMLRNSWDKNATLLAIKSGFNFNHAHADAGSFILYHNGKNLICDSGSGNYSDPNYVRYFCQSEAHNVVLFNGEGENKEDRYTGSNNPGHLYSLLDAGDMKYIYANASGPYAQHLMRNFRHFLWIGNTILVIDDLKSYEPGQFEWLLHYNGDTSVKDGDITIADEDAEVVVRPLFPETLEIPGKDNDEKLKLRVKEGPATRSSRPPVPYYSILNPKKERVAKFVTAIFLKNNQSGSFLPKVETSEGDKFLKIKITDNEKVTYVYYNLVADGRIMHEPSINTFDGWETDATMVAISYNANEKNMGVDEALDYTVIDGSYLRKEDKIVMSSLSKVFMIAKREGATVDLYLDGQPIIDLQLRAIGSPTKVLVNNKPATISFDAFSKLFRLEKANSTY
ncbi:heparinase II/III domain-containing protein [Sunxiuqinia sp. A32]|uniref:heparinase II/III domain-containing protein n=1 Tax=Sunxiuqinia sp. A32 TaxID=3461496 RepID=UPI0040463230